MKENQADFAGPDTGGERATAIYSLIGTAKLNGLDPETYQCMATEVPSMIDLV